MKNFLKAWNVEGFVSSVWGVVLPVEEVERLKLFLAGFVALGAVLVQAFVLAGMSLWVAVPVFALFVEVLFFIHLRSVAVALRGVTVE